MQELILFLERLYYEKNYSPHTIKAYKEDISLFLLFLDEQNLRFEEVSPYFVTTWLEHLEKFNLSPKTLSRRLSSLRSFFNFLCLKKILNKNPFLLFTSPKMSKKIPSTLSVKEINHVFDSMPIDTILERRNRHILMFLYMTGIRSEELCNLQCEGVLWSQNLLRVMGKGSKERLVPLIPLAKDILTQWLIDRKELDKKNSNALFISQNGNPLTTSMIRKIVSSIKPHISKGFHPHAFRYTFASQLLESGANLRHIQELLGHANLSVTQRYTKLSIKDLKNKYQQFHPHA